MSTSAKPSMSLFWGCFMALIATGFGFISRMFLINTWAEQFGLDPAQAGRLAGIGIWPFAVSIILFSLVIDQIGYKRAMIIAFVGHLIWAVMGVSAFFVGDKALGFQLLYWGSLILGLANGTVEAFINPVVATMFSKDKTKWLNMLHAAWPGGLVLAGLITIALGETAWWVKVGLIAIPTVMYFFMLIGQEFPENERVAAGVSYRSMLQEFGMLGALIVAFLVVLQLMDFFSDGSTKPLTMMQKSMFIGVGAVMVVAFGAYTKAIGRGLLIFLCLIMFPLATTEIGTDGWITGILEPVAKANNFHPGWILVYTSAIMLVLRFVAGPIIHALSPLGLLAVSAVLASVGLHMLSGASAGSLFLIATLYGLGKTFFWPTMLGVVAEQTPKGGALTLNAVSGIGMLAVGTLGFPYIGVLQTKAQQNELTTNTAIVQSVPGLVVDGKLTAMKDKTIYEVLTYKTVDDAKIKELVSKLPEEQQKKTQDAVTAALGASNQKALQYMAYFPGIMLVCYLILLGYFKSKGGYKPVSISHSQESEPGF